MDLKAMGYNTTRYIHALYQVMSLAFADRDFYYGDPDFPPVEPRQGLLSKDYAHARAAKIDWTRNDANAKPGDPYPFQGGTNPYAALLKRWPSAGPPKAQPGVAAEPAASLVEPRASPHEVPEGFFAGTTSIEAADEEGWVVSVTPSGGWNPACIAGRT